MRKYSYGWLLHLQPLVMEENWNHTSSFRENEQSRRLKKFLMSYAATTTKAGWTIPSQSIIYTASLANFLSQTECFCGIHSDATHQNRQRISFKRWNWLLRWFPEVALEKCRHRMFPGIGASKQNCPIFTMIGWLMERIHSHKVVTCDLQHSLWWSIGLRKLGNQFRRNRY